MRRAILSIDIGGTKVCLALVSGEGRLLHTMRYPLCESTAKEMPATLFRHIDEFLEANPDLPLRGIGIGLKGMVSADGRTILRSSVLKEILPYDLCGALSARYRLPAALDNDVHAATLAEIRFGAGRNHRDFIYVNMGTGTAAGIAADGKLVRGHRNCAGELGLCLCPRDSGEPPFQLEDVVSGKGLYEETLRLLDEFPYSPFARAVRRGAQGSREVLDHYDVGDPLAKAAVDHFLKTASLALINLALLLDPALFVMGGGLAGDDRILVLLNERVAADCARYGAAWATRIERSSLGADEAGVLGAAAVWLNAMDEGILSK